MNLVKFLFFFAAVISFTLQAQENFTFAVLKYQGGGDWYEGKVGVKNLMRFLKTNTDINANLLPEVIEPSDSTLQLYPFIYMTGHGNIAFSPTEVNYLRTYLTTGGFLYANDDYGMDKSFRREIKKIFPEKKLVKLPKSHPLFSIYYHFPDGTPKIHKHDGGPGITYALYYNGRIVILYTYNTDIGDGWAPYQVHKDRRALRLKALKFGLNIIIYAMTQ
ncbi:MAG TPA: DUF4159 domain-containing protein [Spirochaetota bacterium]|nr:DUF4159 domain-containing protein [Spirochaetota bacterium]